MDQIRELKKIPGLDNFVELNQADRECIRKSEEKNNLGVFEALSREHVIAFTHDSGFRTPVKPIVVKKNGKIFFPGVPFPEIKAKNVVSSSPGYRVDAFLRQKMKAKSGDATLIIGFDKI
jgi:hypothetical protein